MVLAVALALGLSRFRWVSTRFSAVASLVILTASFAIFLHITFLRVTGPGRKRLFPCIEAMQFANDRAESCFLGRREMRVPGSRNDSSFLRRDTKRFAAEWLLTRRHFTYMTYKDLKKKHSKSIKD